MAADRGSFADMTRAQCSSFSAARSTLRMHAVLGPFAQIEPNSLVCNAACPEEGGANNRVDEGWHQPGNSGSTEYCHYV